jgi:nucleotide-binding universal stress UspA family protein
MARFSDPSSGPFVVGYDASPASAAALRLTRTLAAAAGAEVLVATVHRTIPRVLAPGASPVTDEALEDALRAEALQVLDGVPGDDVRREAVPGDSPAEGLHRLAVRERAELIAVGVTHRGAIGRLLVGSVGDRLLHGAPCPVAVVPGGWPGDAAGTVGVAFDGRPESWEALRGAAALAARLDARLEVIGVYDPAPFLWLTSPDPAPAPWDVDELRARFEGELEDAVAELGASVPTSVRAVSGLPGPALVEATHRGIDLLVTGSRGYGPIGGVLARQRVALRGRPRGVPARGRAARGPADGRDPAAAVAATEAAR